MLLFFKAQQLQWEHKHYFELAFSLLKDKQSGTVSTNELSAAMRSIGLSPSEDKLKKVFDAGSSGTLHIDEFQALMLKVVTKPIIDILKNFFDNYDLDHDGYITEDEARQGFKKGGLSNERIQKSVKKMFKEQDIDKDGKIKFEGERIACY